MAVKRRPPTSSRGSRIRMAAPSDGFQRRVIMGGLPRSGSSLIRSILNGHPRILAPRETAVFIHDFDVLRSKSPRISPRIGRRIGLTADLVSELLAEAGSTVEFFDELMFAWRRATGRRDADVWLEKTPRNCRRYAAIRRECPDARFISILRDGRDVVTSVFPGREGYYCSIDRYVRAVRQVMAFENDAHLLVRYEAFVESTKEVLRNIIEHIGVEWSDEMMASYRRRPGLSGNRKVEEPVTDRWVGRWRLPDHADRIRAFYETPEAVECLALSGYMP